MPEPSAEPEKILISSLTREDREFAMQIEKIQKTFKVMEPTEASLKRVIAPDQFYPDINLSVIGSPRCPSCEAVTSLIGKGIKDSNLLKVNPYYFPVEGIAGESKTPLSLLMKKLVDSKFGQLLSESTGEKINGIPQILLSGRKDGQVWCQQGLLSLDMLERFVSQYEHGFDYFQHCFFEIIDGIGDITREKESDESFQSTQEIKIIVLMDILTFVRENIKKIEVSGNVATITMKAGQEEKQIKVSQKSLDHFFSAVQRGVLEANMLAAVLEKKVKPERLEQLRKMPSVTKNDDPTYFYILKLRNLASVEEKVTRLIQEGTRKS